MNHILKTFVVCATLPLWACASYPAPTEHMANSYATIRAARELGAAALPQAALYLQLAEEEQSKAKGLVTDGDNARADGMTLRASADADLALALARDNSARARADVASAQVRTLANKPALPSVGPVSATTTTTSTTVPAVPAK